MKGYENLIKAFYNVKLKSDKKLKLYIIGSGEQDAFLKKLCIQLKLEDSVIFLGQKPHSEVIDELMNSDLFVLSSSVETFGLALLEAISCGLPAVWTRCGGVESFMQDSWGYSCEPNSVVELSNAIYNALNNELLFDIKFRKERSLYIRVNYNSKAISSLYLESLEKKV
ncbi:hypothetical protein CRG86_010165 [Photobacterium leiognathi]|nr:hypothetical protein CRG86_010165 [Photobacterium leiognathi]